MRTRFIRSTEIEQEQLRVIMESDVDMMACGIGAPPDVIAEAKDRKTTLALIGSPHHVPRSLQAGVDIIVAQGYDAGAHTGPIGTLALVPQIVTQQATYRYSWPVVWHGSSYRRSTRHGWAGCLARHGVVAVYRTSGPHASGQHRQAQRG